MLFTSGRVPADMVKKTAAAGIPVLVSKSMPTEDAVRLAAASGICLIGQLREDGFLLFYSDDITAVESSLPTWKEVHS